MIQLTFLKILITNEVHRMEQDADLSGIRMGPELWDDSSCFLFGRAARGGLTRGPKVQAFWPASGHRARPARALLVRERCRDADHALASKGVVPPVHV